MKTVRLYGFTSGWGSYAQVLRGFELGLRGMGYDDTTLAVVALDGTESDEPEERPPLATADIGIMLGPPTLSARLTMSARHAERWVMVAPNSDRIPESVSYAIRTTATRVLAPSGWARDVLQALCEVPVTAVPHGVHPDFVPGGTADVRAQRSASLERLYEDGAWRCLHLSSTGSERKGTLVLLEAWRGAQRSGLVPHEAELWLIVVGGMQMQILDELQGILPRGVRLSPRLGARQEGASPRDLATLFASVHVVCQPSRGEAFGMVPCEALVCGTPVIATTATGHSEWAHYLGRDEGFVRVPTGALGPIDDLPASLAPELDPADVGAALGEGFINWHALKAAALGGVPARQHEWDWVRQLGPLRELLDV